MATVALASALVWPTPAAATPGLVLADLHEQRILEATEPDQAVDPGPAADLLLVLAVRDRLARGRLTAETKVAVRSVDDDRGPSLAGAAELEVGELLQLVLTTRSRGAARSLAGVVAPDPDTTRAALAARAARLGLGGTVLAPDWLAPAVAARRAGAGAAAPRTTARDLARLALTVAADPTLRTALGRDGVPIADGSIIVRASAPLVRTARAPAAGDPAAGPSAIALAERDDLALIAVATGADADDRAWDELARGFATYERRPVVEIGQRVGPAVEVRGGIIPRFHAVATEDFWVTTRRTEPARLALGLQLPEAVEAPVEVQQTVGELVIRQAGRIVAVVPLAAPRAIAPRRWLDASRRPAADTTPD